MISYTPHKIRLIQHNCSKGYYMTLACLKSALEMAHIVLIQEPDALQDPNNQTKNIYRRHNGFEMIRPTEEKPRIMICVDKNNTYRKYQQEHFDNPDVFGLKMWTEGGDITDIKVIHLFNVYNEKRIRDRRPAYRIEHEMLNFNFPYRSILM